MTGISSTCAMNSHRYDGSACSAASFVANATTMCEVFSRSTPRLLMGVCQYRPIHPSGLFGSCPVYLSMAEMACMDHWVSEVAAPRFQKMLSYQRCVGNLFDGLSAGR